MSRVDLAGILAVVGLAILVSTRTHDNTLPMSRVCLAIMVSALMITLPVSRAGLAVPGWHPGSGSGYPVLLRSVVGHWL